MNRLKILMLVAVFAIPARAGATTISFDLNPGGYFQDSPVATNLYASQGLTLSAGVVTACGGECISNPAGTYTGSITGDFMGDAFSYLQFIGVTGGASIQLFDSGHNLVTTLNDSGTLFMPNFEGGFNGKEYLYTGPTAIASWTANLGYDGLIQLTMDQETSAVP